MNIDIKKCDIEYVNNLSDIGKKACKSEEYISELNWITSQLGFTDEVDYINHLSQCCDLSNNKERVFNLFNGLVNKRIVLDANKRPSFIFELVKQYNDIDFNEKFTNLTSQVNWFFSLCHYYKIDLQYPSALIINHLQQHSYKTNEDLSSCLFNGKKPNSSFYKHFSYYSKHNNLVKKAVQALNPVVFLPSEQNGEYSESDKISLEKYFIQNSDKGRINFNFTGLNKKRFKNNDLFFCIAIDIANSNDSQRLENEIQRLIKYWRELLDIAYSCDYRTDIKLPEIVTVKQPKNKKVKVLSILKAPSNITKAKASLKSFIIDTAIIKKACDQYDSTFEHSNLVNLVKVLCCDKLVNHEDGFLCSVFEIKENIQIDVVSQMQWLFKLIHSAGLKWEWSASSVLFKILYKNAKKVNYDFYADTDNIYSGYSPEWPILAVTRSQSLFYPYVFVPTSESGQYNDLDRDGIEKYFLKNPGMERLSFSIMGSKRKLLPDGLYMTIAINPFHFHSCLLERPNKSSFYNSKIHFDIYVAYWCEFFNEIMLNELNNDCNDADFILTHKNETGQLLIDLPKTIKENISNSELILTKEPVFFTQCKIDAKRLHLILKGKEPAIKLSEVQDIVARMKGKANWSELKKES